MFSLNSSQAGIRGAIRRRLLRSLCLLIGIWLLPPASVSSDLASDPGGLVILPQRSDRIFRYRPFQENFSPRLDPHSRECPVFVSEQIYEGLVRLDNSLNIVPALAEYWGGSPDGLHYRFYLRKGVRFHHGDELTARDVKFSLERILDPETETPYEQFFSGRIVGGDAFKSGAASDVSGIRVVDRYTIEIQWTRPLASALYLLSMPFCKILPRDRVLDQGHGFFRNPSGTGPFRFDSWVRDTRLEICGVRLSRFDGYHQVPAILDAVEYCPRFTLEHFLNGEIDALPVLDEKLLERDSRFQIIRDGSLRPLFLGMSCHLAPLSDRRVRWAISRAIDKSLIVRAVHDVRFDRELLYSYIPTQLPGLFLADDRTTYNPAEARVLLAEAGFSGERPFPQLTLFLEYPRDDFDFKLSRELRRQLNAMSISLRVRYYRSLEEIRESRDPYLVLVERLMSFPDPEDVIRPLFYSRSPSNLLGYVSRELDTLLEDAEVQPSWTRRIRIFKRIEMVLQSEVPAVPLFSQQNLLAVQPWVKGIEVPPPMGLDFLKVKEIRLQR